MVSITKTGSDSDWVRARKPEQIEERRAAILDAATELFAEVDYSEVSLNAIARSAGFTKSNVYRYFSSREEIYLVLFLDEYRAWIERLIACLDQLPAESNADQISTSFVNEMLSHKRLLNLAPQLALSLERYSSEEAVLEFKLELAELGNRLAPAWARHLPGATDEDLGFLHGVIHALAAGLWPLCNPSETVLRILARPELSSIKMDFSPLMERAISAMIKEIRNKPGNDEGT